MPDTKKNTIRELLNYLDASDFRYSAITAQLIRDLAAERDAVLARIKEMEKQIDIRDASISSLKIRAKLRLHQLAWEENQVTLDHGYRKGLREAADIADSLAAESPQMPEWCNAFATLADVVRARASESFNADREN